MADYKNPFSVEKFSPVLDSVFKLIYIESRFGILQKILGKKV